jgi:hypothetical protein
MKKLWYLLFLLLLSNEKNHFHTTSINTDLDLSTGLIVNYRMNGNTLDSSGNNLHATNVTATLTDDRFGHPYSAYDFNGVNQFIDMPSHTLLRPSLPITVSYWFKRRSLIANRNTIFILNYTQNQYFGVFSSITLDKMEFSIGNGGTTSPYGRNSLHGNKYIETDKWYFVVCVIRGGNNYNMYLSEYNNPSEYHEYSCCNGDFGYYDGYGTTLQYNNDNGSIGRYDSNVYNPSSYFDGVIDEFKIWNRELSLTEIYRLCKYERFVNANYYN